MAAMVLSIVALCCCLQWLPPQKMIHWPREWKCQQRHHDCLCQGHFTRNHCHKHKRLCTGWTVPWSNNRRSVKSPISTPTLSSNKAMEHLLYSMVSTLDALQLSSGQTSNDNTQHEISCIWVNAYASPTLNNLLRPKRFHVLMDTA